MKTSRRLLNPIMVVMAIVMFSCSTTRDNFFSRTYHQTTAKYNAFFNANESVKMGLKKIISAHEENYQGILPLNKINQKEIIGQVFPNMDRAIEKTINVITRHSMEINNQEKNKWIDDNYFLMAKARFYKKEYLAALNTFKYITRTYSDKDIKNRSIIWSAKCDIRLGNYQTAERALQYFSEQKDLTKKELAELYQTQSIIDIYRKDYQKGIKTLKKALLSTKKRDQRARIHFILGQLNERIKQGDEAIKNYNEVISLNPEYEMSFRASLNKSIAYAHASGSPRELIKDYNKMLKDVKNKDYRDQIYYALAEIKLNQGDTVLGINHLKESLQAFMFNVDQKLQTHLRLSVIYLQKKEYKGAYVQHDSIIMLIEPEDDRYLKIKRAHKKLYDVVKNQDIIHKEDSLLNLAYMTEEERNKKINDHIANLKAEELAKKEEEIEGRQGGNFNLYEYNRNQANIPSSGGWYFYNPTAISFGFSEFLTRWGNRKNEDNWRRKNKNQIDNEDDNIELEAEDEPNEKEKYNREYYLSKIPLTKDQQLLSLQKIERAYYELGADLKNKFSDYNLSADTYEEMLKRFSQTDYKLMVYMQLVFLYDLLTEKLAKKEILGSIKKEFPNNKYINPETGDLIILEEQNKNTEYEKIYNLYSNQEYSKALLLIDTVLQKGNIKDSLNIKLIQAFCISKEGGREEFINALERIKKSNPKTIQGEKSAEMLNILYGSFYEKEDDLYIMTPDSTHQVILTISDLKVDLPELQSVISKHNKKNFNDKELQVNNILLNKQTQIIKISKFPNSKRAMGYYQSMFQNQECNRFFTQGGVETFVISNKNLLSLLKEKRIDDYKIYFKEKYLN